MHHISQRSKWHLSILLPSMVACFSLVVLGCKSKDVVNQNQSGKIEVLDPELFMVLDTQALVEVLADGFTWSEGPVWLAAEEKLLFTDVPENTIYSWDSIYGKQVYLFPSGLDSLHPVGGTEGANGLAVNASGNLLLCQHGNRALAEMLSPISMPTDSFLYLARQYKGKRLNSPNDLHVAGNGDIFFTDPPYGLAGQDQDTGKQLIFNGVYRLAANGMLYLIDSTLTRPNGIALSPDEKTLYVSNSDPEKALWVAYTMDDSFAVLDRRIFADRTEMVASRKGLPDGMKISKSGVIFATGPGGVLVFHPDGRQLGTILTYEATANCALDDREAWLYMTAHGFLKRVRLR